MKAHSHKCVQILTTLALVLGVAGEVQAQRIPDFVVWSAGASLFSPFVAVPLKAGILRLLSLEATFSRLWLISVIEWVVWFPLAFILLRYGHSSTPPLILLALLATIVWLHIARVTNARWGPALLLSLFTPILAFVLWFLAVIAVDRLYFQAGVI